jgi:hypothetical protein
MCQNRQVLLGWLMGSHVNGAPRQKREGVDEQKKKPPVDFRGGRITCHGHFGDMYKECPSLQNVVPICFLEGFTNCLIAFAFRYIDIKRSAQHSHPWLARTSLFSKKFLENPFLLRGFRRLFFRRSSTSRRLCRELQVTVRCPVQLQRTTGHLLNLCSQI